MNLRDLILGKPWITLAMPNAGTTPQGLSRVRTGEKAVVQRFPREALDNPGHAQCRHDVAEVPAGEDQRSWEFSEVP